MYNCGIGLDKAHDQVQVDKQVDRQMDRLMAIQVGPVSNMDGTKLKSWGQEFSAYLP